MRHAKLLWVPWPWRAGFCITDDTDNADLRSVRIVYDLLRSLGLRSTKTVWAFPPDEPCGIPATPPSTLRGITLEDPDYLRYCRELARDGFEIALHGASAGNNRRERTIAAFELLEREFGIAGTYICHSKNADNIYWEEKVAPDATLRLLLKLYSRHRAFGEVEGSRYFWGDICLRHVRRIRLFRTRRTDTLAANPSMPYFEEKKPYVRGWFGATKRSFHDCTTPEALDALCRGNGLTVLYQYMHRYARPDADDVFPQFRKDAERLAGDNRIFVETTARIMERLALMQGLFVGVRGNDCTLFNTNDRDADDLQIDLPDGVRLREEVEGTVRQGETLHIRRIPAGGNLTLRFNVLVGFSGSRAFRINGAGQGSRNFGHGEFIVNLGANEWRRGGERLAPGESRLIFKKGLEEIRPLSRAPRSELLRLFLEQTGIIVRELISGKRSMNADRFLGEGERPLEDHANW